MHELYVITGQTATGKTSLALQTAVEHDGELVNFDSRQIYRKLDIVTGKDITDHSFHAIREVGTHTVGWYPLYTEGHTVPIWMYDVVDPNAYFSSHDYVKLALSVLSDILNRGKTPILVGGTYYYLRHLLYGVASDGVAPDHDLREELNRQPVPALQERLSVLNPDVYASMNNSDKHNPRRLIRKIELSMQNGAVMENNMYLFTMGNKLGKDLAIHIIGLKHINRDTMNRIIAERVKKRIADGAIQEAESLMKSGYTLDNPGMKTIGYPQLYSFLNGNITLEQAIDEWILKEMQYAKRQLTFMSRDPHVSWR